MDFDDAAILTYESQVVFQAILKQPVEVAWEETARQWRNNDGSRRKRPAEGGRGSAALTGKPTLSRRTGDACQTIGHGTSCEESPERKSPENGAKPGQKWHGVHVRESVVVVVVELPFSGAKLDASLDPETRQE